MIALALALAAQPMQSPPAVPSATQAGSSSPAIPPATLDDTLEIVGDPLAARTLASRMAVAVRVNGAGPFRFVVDSGADRTVIGQALATRLNLPTAGAVTLHDTTGSARVETVRIAALGLGTGEAVDIVAPALPERSLGAEGLIGIDALANQRLLLDFARRRVIVEDAARPAPAVAPGEIVVTARRRGGQLILTRVRAGGGDAYAVIDSGAEMTIGNMALRARVLRGRKPPTTTPVTLISVTGRSVQADALTLPEVKVGAITLRNITIAFTDAPPFALFGLETQPAMLLGTDVLASFSRVALDFRRRKVRFVLRR